MAHLPVILITNDDGIYSPGLKAAAGAVADLGELLLVAPIQPCSSMSRACPRGAQTGIVESLTLNINGNAHPAYGVTGSPAQAVVHAVLELSPQEISLCISGVNYGENLGSAITVSGTVGAAMQAGGMKIPSIAVSLETDVNLQHSSTYSPLEWSGAAYFTRYFSEKLLQRRLPGEVALLNVNVPSTATRETPIRVTTQSRQSYFVWKRPKGRDLSTPYSFPYEIGVDQTKLELNSDIKAFTYDRCVSLTPLTLDFTAKIPLEAWYNDFSQ
jgi:5'-nucleotidase